MITHDVEVLVVGLGPVGSVAALYLARHGISVAAIDALPFGAVDLRASTFHAPTIEMLDALGGADVLLRHGLKAPVYQYRDRQSDEIFSFDLGELADRTRYPFRIQYEQHHLVSSLLQILAGEPKVEVAHNRRLIYLEQTDQGVTALVETSKAVERYRARFVIGTDGANSIVRKLLDLDFPGFTYDEKFLCLSTEYPVETAFDNLSYVNYLSDPDEWLVLLRVPDLWRVLVPASQAASDEDLLSDETKDGVFERILGQPVNVETRHRTIYRVHQRVCSRFAVGAICMAGDAVHLNSPMGGFGMNSGVHDAINLGAKLVSILRHGADTELIEQYHRQRHSVTTDFVQTQTIENTKMMSEGWGSARAERRRKMQTLSNDAAARREFLLRQSMFTSLEQAAAIS